MSRIERALEKANMVRDREEPVLPEQSVGQADITDVFVTDNTELPKNPYLVTLNEPDSPIAEEYKKLKSMVVKMTKQGKFQNTLMVTSTVAEEGKSITAMNLAITLACEYDHTVLLVDADLRRPSLSHLLGIETSPGLSDCLLNGLDIKDALVKTGIGKMVFLPSGSHVSDPVELLLSRRMQELLSDIKHRYADRYVIIDTPPVLPFAEVHSLASGVDGLIYVVREGLAPLNGIKEALGMLKGCNVLGFVFNGVELDMMDDYHRYYNYRRYYSRGGNGKK
ncbi:putative Protein tyrosine kinase [Candidatus Sulfobium mesophilum]|uniref:AAA domain-containing protein n=1 Tax=Candidatus Sulfobium mesophilum TaxID=2016548 RepID=A0A2U3QDU5_9BACT|nr:putative Protein tyrosine kinase [Candidatus Sulfobium mesophilum]